MTTSNRQTISYLNRRFRQVGLEPNKRHGQNFLVDLNLVRMIADTGEIQPEDAVLEIGTGTGSLTAMMAEKAGFVVTVEIDEHLHQLAKEELEPFRNVLMLRQDALKNKNNLSPTVLAPIWEWIQAAPGRGFKLVANLPYNVATPIISNLLMLEHPPKLVAVTIQKELGERMMAKPSTKDYSALSVWVQALCDVSIVRVLPPNVFWPAPKVDSAIMRIQPIPEKRAAIPDLAFFHTFTRALFFHRRKFLRSVIIAAFKEQLDKPQVDAVLAELPFYSSTTRAEELTVAQIQELSERFRLAVKSAS
ncbi:MAG: ribosomal RNA small subunit methyltransferase A [Planctomycetaceae bacterium]|jgi:16S rRNA (adenine1518-N6/adenine1519-N6)-dimethyltransferase|nr:ribosomal RNA small subunit methyltransferase A [Planctomycetaceae bacterium]